MLVTLPFALLLLDCWPLARTHFGARAADAGPRCRAPAAAREAPLFALSAAASAITFVAQQLARLLAPDLPLALRLANAAVSSSRYLELRCWPTDLSVLYPLPFAPELAESPGAPRRGRGGRRARARSPPRRCAARRRPYLAVGWLWFLGTLVPVIGLVQVGAQAMADRYTYVPLIGLFIALAWGARDAIAALGARPVLRAAAGCSRRR